MTNASQILSGDTSQRAYLEENSTNHNHQSLAQVVKSVFISAYLHPAEKLIRPIGKNSNSKKEEKPEGYQEQETPKRITSSIRPRIGTEFLLKLSIVDIQSNQH